MLEGMLTLFGAILLLTLAAAPFLLLFEWLEGLRFHPVCHAAVRKIRRWIQEKEAYSLGYAIDVIDEQSRRLSLQFLTERGGRLLSDLPEEVIEKFLDAMPKGKWKTFWMAAAYHAGELKKRDLKNGNPPPIPSQHVFVAARRPRIDGR